MGGEKNLSTLEIEIKIFNHRTMWLMAGGILIIGGIFAWCLMAYGFNQYLTYFTSASEGEINQGVEINVGEAISPLSIIQARKLDGIILKEGQVDKYPVAIMIENLVSARPQSGLSRADLVYETLVEGGITRFMAVYSRQDAEEIGPVRSARPYYVEWVAEYNALYAHCGGSPEALSSIQVHQIKDLNQIGGAQAYYWRDKSKSAPHNLFTNVGLMDIARLNQGVKEIKPIFEPWQFKDEKNLEERPTEAKFIKINFSTGISYQVEYHYDRESNDYLRFNGGREHLDKINKEQLRAKNIIVQYVPEVGYYSSGKGRIIMDVTSDGKAACFVDGGANIGTWKKENTQARTRYFDENDREIVFNRGTTWIEVVPVDRTIEYN